jgi:hypothetical protein
MFAVNQVSVADKLPPKVVAISSDQGVVQVKNSQGHKDCSLLKHGSIAANAAGVNFSGSGKCGTMNGSGVKILKNSD